MHDSIYALLPRDDDNGASHGRRALVVTAVLTTISIVIVAMRFPRSPPMPVGRERPHYHHPEEAMRKSNRAY
jgi:hypothetical protein